MSKKLAKGGGSNTTIKAPNKPLEESILDIINDISKRQYSLDFREPVDVKALSLNDYYDIIKKPMDLTTLKNNYLEGQYKTIKEIWDDFDLIVINCKTYNRLPDHPINQKADQMKSRVDKSMQKLVEDYKALGVDTDAYQIRIDHEDLKAKEEKKRKIKLDGLDEKNILMGGDKRLYIPPGSLNEKKLFELQNQDLQMMQQSGRVPSFPMNQQNQFEENIFQVNSLKIIQTPGMNQSQIVSTTSIQGEVATPTNNQVGIKQPKLTGEGTQQVKKVKDYSAKLQEAQAKGAQLKVEFDILTKRKSDCDRQRILTKNVFILSKKERKRINQLVEAFEQEEKNLVNPNGTTNNLPTQTNLNGSASKYLGDPNDAESGSTLKTSQQKDLSTNPEERKSRKMEIENGEIYQYNEDDDDDIVIKKKGNPLEDSSQKTEKGDSDMNGAQNGPTKIKIQYSSSSSALNKEANSSTQLNDSKVSSKGQKSNNDSNIYSTPTKSQLLNNSSLSSEKIKQNAKTNNLNNLDSKTQNASNDDGEESEEEFKPTSLNTRQQPSDTSTPQQSQSIKLTGLKATSSTASSAHLKHKLHQNASGEKILIKKPNDPNSMQRKEMVTPEKKSLSLGKKDGTPEKINSLNKINHSHQTHGKLNTAQNSQKRPLINGSQNGQSSLNNLSPQSQELKQKKSLTPPKSALSSQGKGTMAGNIQPQKKLSTDSIIKVTLGGEQIQKFQTEGASKVKKTEEGLKIKLKDPIKNTSERDTEETKSNKITITNLSGTQLPAPELKQSQSMKAAQILLMGQEKKNREMEEKQKTEEQKRLEEFKKRQNILKKKEMKLLQAHQQQQAAAAAAAAAAAQVNNNEGSENKPNNNTIDLSKIILLKNQSNKPEEGTSMGQNLIKIPLDPSLTKMNSSQYQSTVPVDISYNSRQIYDKIIPSKPKKSHSIQLDPAANNSTQANINYNKIKINVGGSPVVPTAVIPNAISSNTAIQNFPVPQISVGGERVDFKFVLDRKSLRKECENMIKRKQQKYKKLLEVNLTKMQKVTNWMIKEWAKQKKDVRSETLDYFRDILNERQKIKDNLDIRKIQLFLKMFLYRLRDFYKDLKSDYIDKLKNISEKLYRIGSRAIVYKSPLPHRDNIKNASCDIQVNNNQILDESHPLKKLQEEILEIEREMKLFRRMLSRDIQKYQEQPDAAAQKTKKSKNKDESNQYNGSGEQDQQGGFLNAGQGFDDSKDVIYGVGDKDQQQKQSEILSFFLEYNKQFEKQTSDLQRIQRFLGAPIQSKLLNSLFNPVKSDQIFDICETIVEDDEYNPIEILDYIKKKRKVSASSSSESLSNKNAETKIEEEGEQSKKSQDEESNTDLFENITLSFNFNTQSKEEEGNQNSSLNVLRNSNEKPAVKNIFSILGDDDDESTVSQDEIQYETYKNSKLTNVNTIMRKCNSGSEILERTQKNGQIISQSIPDLDYQGIKKFTQMLRNQIINKKVIFDIYRDRKRRKILDIRQPQIQEVNIYQKKRLSDEYNIYFLQKQPYFPNGPKIKFRILDENKITGVQGLLNLVFSIDIRLERDFGEGYPSSQMDIENLQSQEQFLEFSLKNSINNISHAYFSDIQQIKQQLQHNCKENAELYSLLCSEDVEQVVQSFKPQEYLHWFINQEPDLLQQLDSQSASLIKLIKYNKIRRSANDKIPSNNSDYNEEGNSSQEQLYNIELSLWTPINCLKDVEIKLNNMDIFTPQKLLQRYYQKVQQKQQFYNLQQQQQQHHQNQQQAHQAQ